MNYKRKNIDIANEPNANNTDNNKQKYSYFCFPKNNQLGYCPN